MKITRITSHVLQYDLPEPLGYSQQYGDKRTAHLVDVETDAYLTGWGEFFGPSAIAPANGGRVSEPQAPGIGVEPDRDFIELYAAAA